MKVFINLVIFSSDIPNKKRYILSTDKDSLQFPRFEINEQNRNTIPETICDFIREHYLLANDYELLPKFIQVHSDHISKENDRLEMVFSSVVDFETQRSENKCFWKDFDLFDNTDKEKAVLLINCVRNLS